MPILGYENTTFQIVHIYISEFISQNVLFIYTVRINLLPQIKTPDTYLRIASSVVDQLTGFKVNILQVNDPLLMREVSTQNQKGSKADDIFNCR